MLTSSFGLAGVSKVASLVAGYNSNVRHRGAEFHIQTEDSGTLNPKIVTHLFADGGRILRTLRTDYKDELERAELREYVRERMRAQHKAMYLSLRAGELDLLIESACGPLALPAVSRAVSQPSLPPELATRVPSPEARTSVQAAAEEPSAVHVLPLPPLVGAYSAAPSARIATDDGALEPRAPQASGARISDSPVRQVAMRPPARSASMPIPYVASDDAGAESVLEGLAPGALARELEPPHK